MSNSTDQNNFTDVNTPAARVAYTINNYQPVTCTIIGSDPLFYEDVDHAELEAELNQHDMSFLSAEMGALGKELNTLEKFSSQYALSTDDYICVFEEAKNSITGVKTAQATAISAVTDIIKQSRIGQSYLDHAAQYGLEIVSNAEVKGALYDRQNNSIRINPHLAEEYQVLLALRELRRHWQHRNGALVNPMMFHPENAILINRAQNADLVASMVRGAWELQLSGYKGAWKAIENSAYADLGRAFTREAYMDFRTINSGLASTAVFEAWFLSERCRTTDKTLIRQMLADNQGYVFDIDNEYAALTPTVISALGSMPFGKNYLAPHIATIMNDPIFSEVRDRSNANFLWFIKFERSFRETERDLQTEFSSAADQSGASPNNTQGQSDEEKIVVLYDKTQQPNPEHGSVLRTGTSGAGAQIIHLRRAPQNEGAL